jgi:hypothetical protein
MDDVVYQGPNYLTANAYGVVVAWDQNTNHLTIGSSQGQFLVNNTIRAVTTNAAYNISSFDATPLKLSNIHIEPKPNTANPGNEFGYDVTITEWPNIS